MLVISVIRRLLTMICTTTWFFLDTWEWENILQTTVDMSDLNSSRKLITHLSYGPCWNWVSTRWYRRRRSWTTAFMWPRIPLRYLQEITHWNTLFKYLLHFKKMIQIHNVSWRTIMSHTWVNWYLCCLQMEKDAVKILHSELQYCEFQFQYCFCLQMRNEKWESFKWACITSEQAVLRLVCA